MSDERYELISVVLALLSAFSYGVSDFFGGVAARKVAAIRVVIVSYPVSIVAALAVAPFVGGSPSLSDFVWGGLAGVAGGLAILWFFQALAAGTMSVVSPLTAVLVAGIPVVVGVVAGERPKPLAFLGIGVALAAVVLVGRESGGGPLRLTRSVILLTVASGSAFAVDFVSLHEIDSSAGLWPLVLSRVTATVVVWSIAIARRQFRAPDGPTLRMACAVGILDVIANGALLYAYHGGMLSLVSVIGALYPATTVLLAMTLLGERIGRGQQGGMVLALTAVGLIAAA